MGSGAAIIRDGSRLRELPAGQHPTYDAAARDPAELDRWLAALDVRALVLDVEPERTREWVERVSARAIPLLLRDPLGGSIEEYEQTSRILGDARVAAMPLRRFGFAAGPSQAASVLQAGRVGAPASVRLTMSGDLRGNLQSAADDKARYDVLFENLADLLSAARRLGADLATAALVSPLSSRYWRALEVGFEGPVRATLHPAEPDEEEVVVQGTQGTFRWLRRGDREAVELTEGAHRRAAPLASRPFLVRVVHCLVEAVDGGTPLYEDFADQAAVFEATSRILDDYLYGRALELRSASREHAIATLRGKSPFWQRLTPYSYQDWTTAFKAELEVCDEILRPLSGRFSILLVRAPFPIRTDTVPPPLGIAQIAGVAQAAGADVTLVDLVPELGLLPGETWTEANLDELVATLKAKVGERRFDLVGFSLDDLTMWPVVERLALDVARPIASHVVLGGRPAGRVDRDSILRSGAVDFVIEGEGELGLMQLVRHLMDEAPLDEVSGLWARAWPAERMANPPIFPVFECHAPPCFDGLDLGGYTTKKPKLRSPYLSYLFILGCPYRCAFCGNESAQRPRHRPAPLVVRDLAHLRARHGVEDFYFLNNMINTNSAVLAELIEAMEQADLGIRWVDCGRPAKLDRTTLERMAAVGCVELTWGIDTGSQRLHNLMRKGYRIDSAMQVLRDAAEVGIDNTVNLIVGMPHETDEDFEETLRFVRDNASIIGSFAVHPYFYAYKSPVRNTPSKFGLRRKGDTYDEIHGSSWREHLRQRDERVRRVHEEIARVTKVNRPASCG